MLGNILLPENYAISCYRSFINITHEIKIRLRKSAASDVKSVQRADAVFHIVRKRKVKTG